MNGISLPFARVESFLPSDEHAAILEYILASRSKFGDATVRSGDESIVAVERRIALVCRDFGSLRPLLHRRFLEALPKIMPAIGASGAPPTIIELELAAHGDGAFYRAHTDLPLGETRKRRQPEPDRVISAVYYLHAEPKGFSGGQLRLFQLGNAASVDVEPTQNGLVAFHSWVPHEVRSISCPSGDFRDFRFAINCWFRR